MGAIEVTALPVVTLDERRRRLATRHRLALADRAETPIDVARSVVGLHSSDPVTVYLSAAQRMRSGSIDAISDALYRDRTLFRIHAMRRTLWALPPELVAPAHVSTTTALVRTERKRLANWLVDSGITDDPHEWIDSGCAALLAELERRGEATTRELGEAVPDFTSPIQVAAGTPYGATVPAHTRLLVLLGFVGAIVRTRPIGSWVSGQYRWATMAAWSSDRWSRADLPTIADAQATIVDAYLRAFGPVTVADAQWWLGFTKTVVVKTLKSIGAVEVETDHGHAFVAAGDDVAPEGDAPGPWLALLPGLDPTTMGWKQRSWYVGDEFVPHLFDRSGNAGPTVWADGEIVGAWAQRLDGSIATRLLAPISKSHQRQLDAEIERLRELVGDTRFHLRFPSPLGRELAQSGSESP